MEDQKLQVATFNIRKPLEMLISLRSLMIMERADCNESIICRGSVSTLSTHVPLVY
jgi:hypothetical protein